MKKYIFTFCVLLISFSAKTQLFVGGIDFGLVASQVDGDEYGGYNKAGLNVDVYASLVLKPNLHLTSGVGYIQKGAHSNIKTDYFVTRLHYAEVPIVLNYQPFDKISFSAGIIYGFLISGKFITDWIEYGEEQLNLRKSEFSNYGSVNYHISDKLTVKFVSNYSTLPITKPYSWSCWRNNIIFYYIFRDASTVPCWWNNVIRITFQYQIF